MKKISKAIIYIAFVLLLVVVIGVVFTLTGGGKTDFKQFFLVYNNKIMVNGNVQVVSGDILNFKTKYLIKDDIEVTAKDIKVKILPNVDNDTNFSFTVNGIKHWFSDEKDFSKSIDCSVVDNEIILSSKISSIRELLETVYSGQTVNTDWDSLDNSYPYLKMIVSSYKYDNKIEIGLIIYTEVKSVEFNSPTYEL